MMTNLERYTTWDQVPDHLKTKTSLGKIGLKLARGQTPVAIKLTNRTSRIGDVYLYDAGQAVPKRKPTPEELERLAAARRKAMTTTCCNTFTGMINWRYKKTGMCWDCWAAEKEAEFQEFLAEAEAEARVWARAVLADPGAIILDTETTGLSLPEILEIAVIRAMDGETLLNRRCNPVGEIEPGATAVHGVTKADLEGEPRFGEIWAELRPILEGASRVVIYNASFDRGALGWTCRVHELAEVEYAAECAMEKYACWVGEWSDYWRNFRWQPLGGGHDALGDCQATRARLVRMAESGSDISNGELSVIE